MEQLMRIRTIVLGAVAGAGALMALATSASAYVVCNSYGDCWHTESHWRAPGVRFDYHPDDWYFHRRWDNDDRYHWRSDYHRDRGYWRNGIWITF
jgi:hypothetical protein